MVNDKRLLLIDDEPAFGDFVKDVAEGLGYDVKITAKADEFAETYESFGPSVIVLDVVMPEVEGIELLQYLADSNWVGPVLVISGYNPEYLRLAKAIGASRGLPLVITLAKPVHAGQLRSALAEARTSAGS